MNAHCWSLLAAAAGCLAMIACGSSQPEVTPEPVERESTPQERVLAPVPHDGPLQADPTVYDCGTIPLDDFCEVDVMLTNGAGGIVVIEEISQNFSPYARIALVEHRTAFDRDLPYEMGSEALRLIFSYRRDDADEVVGGSFFVDYRQGTQTHRLEIPIGASP